MQTGHQHTLTNAPELLAPAGDWEAMRAAVANGADSVYFGLEKFNARHRATNFGQEELPTIMKYLHDHNVRGFLTFNTLIFSDELPAAVDYIKSIAAAGVDAVIVQDLGLAQLIHAIVPTLPIHGSTQMTLTEPLGMRFVRELGVQRVVLARELALDDIKRIREATDLPVEVFVHGALCVAYSGQCLTSESLGGRSANRGQCAQACRLPYDLIVDGEIRDLTDRAYLLSPQDLAAYDLIHDLANLGVASFKIEGRLKSAHYVAATTQTYRQALDSARRGSRFQITPQQRGDLEQTFSRGFTHGFLDGVNHQRLVAGRFPKSRGRRIGTVQQVTRDGIIITLDNGIAASAATLPLKPGDGVVFDEGHPEQDEQGGRVFASQAAGRHQLRIELGHGDVNLSALAPGAIVWKTDDPAIRRRLEHSFSRETVANRVTLNVHVIAHVGQPLVVRFTDDVETTEAVWPGPLQKAQKHAVSVEPLREQLGRLGDTPFEIGQVTLDACGEPMVPKSVLNDLRRQGVTELLDTRARRRPHAIAEPDALDRFRAELMADVSRGDEAREPVNDVRLTVMVRTLDQLEGVLAANLDLRPSMVYCDFEDVRKHKQAVARCRAESMPVALATLRIVKPHEHGLLRQIADCAPDAVLVRNLAAVCFYKDHAPSLPQIGDYSLNVSNELTAGIFTRSGLVRLVPSYDLNWRQLAAMMSRFDTSKFECVVHQHMPMFHMEHCVFCHTLSTGTDYRDCGRPCEKHAVDLRDRMGQPHPLLPDVGCRNTVYNAAAQSAAEFVPEMRKLGVSWFRVELLREKQEDVAPLLARYAEVLLGKSAPKAAIRSLKVLTQLGVTRGTLDRE